MALESLPKIAPALFSAEQDLIQIYNKKSDTTGVINPSYIKSSPSGISGAIQFSDGSAFASDSANLFWDDTNKRLGIGTNAPAYNLQVNSTNTSILTISSNNSNNNSTELRFLTNNGTWSSQIRNWQDSGGANQGLYIQSGGIFTSGSINAVFNTSGNTFFGNTLTPATARLHVRGSGSTSATTSLLVQNSGGSQLFKIADDGFTTINGRLYLLGDNIYNSGSQPALGVGNTMYMASNTGIDFSWQNLVQGRFAFTTNVNTNNSVGSPKNSLYTSHTINDGAASSLSEFRSMAVLDTMNMTTFPLTTFIGLFISPTIVSSTTKVRAIQSTIGGAYFNTSSVNATAILQADSTTQGFLPPRMTTAQKNAIATPAAGLVVFDTDLNKLCVRGASAWETITSV